MLAPLVLASVSDKLVEPIVDLATEFIGSAGVVAVFLLMTVESACVPIPSEAIMLFAGFSVSNGELTLFGVVSRRRPGKPGRLLDRLRRRIFRAP